MGMFSRKPAAKPSTEVRRGSDVIASLDELVAVAGVSTVAELQDYLDGTLDASGELEFNDLGDTLELVVMNVSHTITFPTTLQDVLDVANEVVEDCWPQRTYEDWDLFDN